MASISLQQLNIVEDILNQISDSIHNLEAWNESISDARDFHLTPEGVKTLAADCMLIEAIGEGIKRIDERTNGLLQMIHILIIQKRLSFLDNLYRLRRVLLSEKGFDC